MQCKPITATLLFVFLLGIPCVAAEAPPLFFKFTKANVPGSRGTIPVGINNAGATVGAYLDKKLVWHGYILDGKKVTTLDDPDGKPGTTYADGLNPDGTIRLWATTRIPAAILLDFCTRKENTRTLVRRASWPRSRLP
jgi:hypothetical protein